ncbi:RidA family protein [Chloroflexota bacterium]
MDREFIQPSNVRTVRYLSQAVKVGNTVYVSGQIAWDANGDIVGKGDFSAQVAQVFRNAESVLNAAQASVKDIVKITTYVTCASDAARWRQEREKYFPDNPPASTTIIAAGLAQPDYLIEVEAIAVI